MLQRERLPEEAALGNGSARIVNNLQGNDSLRCIYRLVLYIPVTEGGSNCCNLGPATTRMHKATFRPFLIGNSFGLGQVQELLNLASGHRPELSCDLRQEVLVVAHHDHRSFETFHSFD